jgi:hypothetical protein
VGEAMIHKSSIVIGWATMFISFVILGLLGNDLWRYVFTASLVLGAIAAAVRNPRP